MLSLTKERFKDYSKRVKEINRNPDKVKILGLDISEDYNHEKIDEIFVRKIKRKFKNTSDSIYFAEIIKVCTGIII